MPLVSIIIPVYNGDNFLSEAIDSALSQSYQNLEILVVNDGSVDQGATRAVAESYGNRIRYFEKPNGGVASALNLGFEKMVGEYSSWLSHDDLYVRDKVEKQVRALANVSHQNRSKTILYSDFSVFSTDADEAIPVRMRGVASKNFRYWITSESSLHGCTLLVSREAFISVGGFNESLRTTQDYELWFRMAAQCYFVHIPEVLVKARSHEGQGTMSMPKQVVAEGNELLSGFVTNLTHEELIHATGRSLLVAYSWLASSMFQRGFFVAGWTATRLSFANLQITNLGDGVCALCNLGLGIIKYVLLKPVRILMPAYLRVYLRDKAGF